MFWVHVREGRFIFPKRRESTKAIVFRHGVMSLRWWDCREFTGSKNHLIYNISDTVSDFHHSPMCHFSLSHISQRKLKSLNSIQFNSALDDAKPWWRNKDTMRMNKLRMWRWTDNGTPSGLPRPAGTLYPWRPGRVQPLSKIPCPALGGSSVGSDSRRRISFF